MNYLKEVNEYIKKVEIGKSIREINANRELVECYWNVRRLIVEAQGGKEKSKYGNELLKKLIRKAYKRIWKGVMIIVIWQGFVGYICVFQN